MKQRCTNPNNTNYKNYGARGISVCDRWMKSFRNFIEDMGPRPLKLSIERINNDGNYEPGNCIWADAVTQLNNTKRNRMLTYNCKTQSVSNWARKLGANRASLYSRIRYGWSDEQVITTPIEPMSKAPKSTNNSTEKQYKGFRAMKRSMVAKIASMGGKAVAKLRGSKHMARIGSIGGSNSHRNTNAKG